MEEVIRFKNQKDKDYPLVYEVNFTTNEVFYDGVLIGYWSEEAFNRMAESLQDVYPDLPPLGVLANFCAGLKVQYDIEHQDITTWHDDDGNPITILKL